jgi:hypothetical protein
MKNIQGVINAINRTEFTDTFEGMDVKYKIGVESITKNEYGTLRTRYYIKGKIEAFNYNPENFKGKIGVTVKLYKYFMQKAYDFLIKKLSIDHFVLLDLKQEDGSVSIWCYTRPDTEGGPVAHEFLSTARSVAAWNQDYANEDWTAYHTERFERW